VVLWLRLAGWGVLMMGLYPVGPAGSFAWSPVRCWVGVLYVPVGQTGGRGEYDWALDGVES
jgi:hypothetical protein